MPGCCWVPPGSFFPRLPTARIHRCRNGGSEVQELSRTKKDPPRTPHPCGIPLLSYTRGTTSPTAAARIHGVFPHHCLPLQSLASGPPRLPCSKPSPTAPLPPPRRPPGADRPLHPAQQAWLWLLPGPGEALSHLGALPDFAPPPCPQSPEGQVSSLLNPARPLRPRGPARRPSSLPPGAQGTRPRLPGQTGRRDRPYTRPGSCPTRGLHPSPLPQQRPPGPGAVVATPRPPMTASSACTASACLDRKSVV